ncbi:hypothetical protein [Campylobacter sp.]|uniref:hypothetical protein n=1 Tax=Campylobacter sp. TaxID=205 RepID=UPI002A388A3E|nr:hypothetical protein [Campylobacter sp.]MDD6926224.1 hypothetical protein [Campylobacteraceae bacterium]MDD7703814.1 hypothetical protein [Campylobacteraceae bacterium]MDY2635227.1 hypothetical protein [Campylobacter sp.]
MIENSVFIAGSISIKTLPDQIINSIDKMMEHNMFILIGDAKGIDEETAKYLYKRNYKNVKIYSVEEIGRSEISKKFPLQQVRIPAEKMEKIQKKVREQQYFKDEKMSEDCEFALMVWDGKSKGTYQNIKNLFKAKKDKKTKIFYQNDFLKDTSENNIDYIFSQNAGYTVNELLNFLKEDIEVENFFDNFDVKKFNKFLVDQKFIEKQENIYYPCKKYENFMIIQTYKGKTSGIKFKNEFIDEIKSAIKNSFLNF